jgi:HD-GYP domain-containing protein (c-di-GMP phosphodiesterase class II)
MGRFCGGVENLVRKVPTEYLTPGMITAKHLYADDGRVLLAEGVELNTRYINRLMKKGIPALYIKDQVSADVVVEDVVLDNTRNQAVVQIKQAITHLTKKVADKKINIVNINQTITNIVDQLLENKDIVYNLADIRSVDNYLFSHSVNVCILSVMTGIALQYNRNQLEDLAKGALLHDVGKAMVPYEVLNKPGKLTPEEFDEIKKHPGYSLEILRKNPGVSSVSRIIAYQHHEKCNGEGYPAGLTGKDIMDASQIVGMADMYDAITSDRCYRGAMPPNEAYELISASGDYYFKFDIVKTFLDQIAAYPVGSFVELSTGEIAVVIENKKGYSLKPKLRIIISPDRRIIKPFREIDLIHIKDMVITRILKEQEIQPIYSLLDPASGAAGPLGQGQLINSV